MSQKMNAMVKAKFESYPDDVREHLVQLRTLVMRVAAEENLGEVEESLKWGQLSYRTKNGSPLRIDWKSKSPNEYAMYFVCSTRLVETFRELYQDSLQFEGNREITFTLEQILPEQEVRQCVSMALNYHKVKHLPLLGA